MITIRQGHIDDFKQLNQPWAWSQAAWHRQAQEDYIKGIEAGTQEFLVVEYEGVVIGELHIYWDKKDKEEANGKDRAYLSALRIHPDYRGQGLGTKLMQAALQRIKENGYSEATIGAYEKEHKLQELYKKWGFDQFVKEAWEETSEYKMKFFLYLQRLL